MDDTRTSLLRRIQDPEDGLSWVEFDRIYRPLLLQYALVRGLKQEEAEEIAQQCMAAIASGISDFQRRVSFRGWLRGMIDHKVSDRLRNRQKEVGAKTADFDRAQQREESPNLLWERQWNRTHLLYCLNQIKGEIAPVTYEAFVMYALEERSVREICTTLSMTPNQVYVAKSRVLERLRAKWSQLDDGLM